MFHTGTPFSISTRGADSGIRPRLASSERTRPRPTFSDAQCLAPPASHHHRSQGGTHVVIVAFQAPVASEWHEYYARRFSRLEEGLQMHWHGRDIIWFREPRPHQRWRNLQIGSSVRDYALPLLEINRRLAPPEAPYAILGFRLASAQEFDAQVFPAFQLSSGRSIRGSSGGRGCLELLGFGFPDRSYGL